MGGFLKGAILGLVCAVAFIGAAALLGPSVDPAKHSDAPKDAEDNSATGSGPKMSQSDVAQKANPEVDAKAETPVEAPMAPERLAEVDTSVASEVTPAQMEKKAQPAAPKVVEAPVLQDTPKVDVTQDAAVDVAQAATELPDAPLEQASGVETTPATPVVEPVEEVVQAPVVPVEPVVVPEAVEEEVVAIEPEEAPVVPEERVVVAPAEEAAPVEEAEVAPELRAQSLAESQESPPAVQVETPQAPRAVVRRPVVSGKIGQPVGNFVNDNTRVNAGTSLVQSDRLPSISDGSEGAEQATLAPTTPNALRDNGARFEALGKPLIGVLLIEDQNPEEDAARLALIQEFGQPVTIALDPLSQGVKARAEAYHQAGADIIILSSLPDSLTPSDIEVTLAAYQENIPMAIAVMNAPNAGGMRPSRQTLQHVTAILNDAGLGLVAQKQGLNSAQQLANKTGVPNIKIFYDVTPAETQDSLRTIFNRSIFRATQKGASVVTVPGDVSSLTALQAWALVDRPASVQMAPISAILLGVASQ